MLGSPAVPLVTAPPLVSAPLAQTGVIDGQLNLDSPAAHAGAGNLAPNRGPTGQHSPLDEHQWPREAPQAKEPTPTTEWSCGTLRYGEWARSRRCPPTGERAGRSCSRSPRASDHPKRSAQSAHSGLLRRYSVHSVHGIERVVLCSHGCWRVTGPR
jgi:hypothetical protein